MTRGRTGWGIVGAAFGTDEQRQRGGHPLMSFLAAIVLTLLLAIGWFAQLLGLPGNWLIVAAAAFDAWLVDPESRAAVGWNTVVGLALLAVAGEVVELVAGALGVSRVGGSRRGALLAIVGSMVGSLVGVVVGLPIPIVGSLAAAVLFGGVGALVGAVLGERWKGRGFDASLEVGKAALVGRILGTVAKMVVSTIMVVVALAALVM
jgi:uncharacterized protein